jgi:hypothetical protein
MSALPPKADIHPRNQDVCFGPEADIAHLFDHLVGRHEEAWWHRKAERLRRFAIDTQQIFHRHLHRKLRLLCASQDIVHIAGRTPKIVAEVCAIAPSLAKTGFSKTVGKWLRAASDMIVARWLVMKLSGPPKRAPPGSRPMRQQSRLAHFKRAVIRTS